MTRSAGRCARKSEISEFILGSFVWKPDGCLLVFMQSSSMHWPTGNKLALVETGGAKLNQSYNCFQIGRTNYFFSGVRPVAKDAYGGWSWHGAALRKRPSEHSKCICWMVRGRRERACRRSGRLRKRWESPATPCAKRFLL